jgi:hypothetical protein
MKIYVSSRFKPTIHVYLSSHWFLCPLNRARSTKLWLDLGADLASIFNNIVCLVVTRTICGALVCGGLLIHWNLEYSSQISWKSREPKSFLIYRPTWSCGRCHVLIQWNLEYSSQISWKSREPKSFLICVIDWSMWQPIISPLVTNCTLPHGIVVLYDLATSTLIVLATCPPCHCTVGHMLPCQWCHVDCTVCHIIHIDDTWHFPIGC